MRFARSVPSALLVSGLIGSMLLVAPPASAATGDITEFTFPDAASAPGALASAADGTLWITQGGSALLSKAGLDGKISTVLKGGSSNPGPTAIALGSDKRMWMTEETSNEVSAVTPATGAVAGYPLPTKDAKPRGIASGQDGNLWFTQFAADRVARISTAGSITEFSLAKDSGPTGIAAGPDGNLWFTLTKGNAIGRITPTGVVSTYPLQAPGSQPTGIVAGPDGNLWFTMTAGDRIGRITPKGLLGEFALPYAGAKPGQIVAGADKALWFTMPGVNRVGRITTSGSISSYAIGTPGSSPSGITSAADGNIWFTQADGNRLARVLTGVVPVSTGPAAITGTSTAVGQTLTVTNGTWSWLPTSYTYQWQRCETADASSCSDIANATASSYVITSDDAGKRMRVLVKAINLNGTSASAAASNVQAIDGLPPTPPPPAVSGGQTVTVAAGVTAKLTGPKRVKRGTVRRYTVRFSDAAVRGRVRISLVSATGVEVKVIAKARSVKATGKATRLWRMRYRVAPGSYVLKAVYTPSTDQASTYAVATMTKPILVRR